MATLSDLITVIRTHAAAGTAARIEQGRLLVQIRADRLWVDGYKSFADFISRSPIGLSRSEAYRQISVAELSDTDARITATLPWCVLRELPAIRRQRPDDYERLIADPALGDWTVDRIRVAAAKDHWQTWAQRAAKSMRSLRKRLETASAEERDIITEEALALLDALDRRAPDTAEPSPHGDNSSPINGYGNGMDINIKTMEPSITIVASETETAKLRAETETIPTPAGDVERPVTRSAVLAALAGWGVTGAAALVPDGDTVEAAANLITWIRYQIAAGDRQAPKVPGAAFRHRLSRAWTPPEDVLAMIRRLPDAPVSAVKTAGPPVSREPVQPERIVPAEARSLVDSLRAAGSHKPWVQVLTDWLAGGQAVIEGAVIRLGRVTDFERALVGRYAVDLTGMGFALA